MSHNFQETLDDILNEITDPDLANKDMNKTNRVLFSAISSELKHERTKMDIVCFKKHPKFDSIKAVSSVKLIVQRTPLTIKYNNLNITVNFTDAEDKGWNITFNKFKVPNSSLSWDVAKVIWDQQLLIKGLPDYINAGKLPDILQPKDGG